MKAGNRGNNPPEDEPMKTIRILGAVAMAGLLAACGQPEQPNRAVVAPDGQLTLATQGIDNATVYRTSAYAVQDVVITVPSNLRASEANVYYPLADIVWRGDALGNRHEQVRAILAEAADQATAGMTTGPAAVVEITVNRFHSVTEKTRYSVGGVHSVNYTLTVRDAVSGDILDGPRVVIADVRATGGVRALAEDEAGRTMKVVIIERLVQSFREELTKPVPQALVTQSANGPVLIAN
jgi:hypothetical protein